MTMGTSWWILLYGSCLGVLPIRLTASEVVSEGRASYATQRGIWNGQTAELALDGNLEQTVREGSCARPFDETYKGTVWWMVDLGSDHAIQTVTIYGGNEELYEPYLGYISVRVSDSADIEEHTEQCALWDNDRFPKNSNQTLVCDQVMYGRYVSIQRTGGKNMYTMVLCEVLIQGFEVASNNSHLPTDNNNDISTGLLVGLVVGSCALVAVVATIVYCRYRRSRRQAKEPSTAQAQQSATEPSIAEPMRPISSALEDPTYQEIDPQHNRVDVDISSPAHIETTANLPNEHLSPTRTTGSEQLRSTSLTEGEPTYQEIDPHPYLVVVESPSPQAVALETDNSSTNPYDKPHPYVNAEDGLVKPEYEKMKSPTRTTVSEPMGSITLTEAEPTYQEIDPESHQGIVANPSHVALETDGNPSLETDGNPSLETDGIPALETDGNPSLETDGNPSLETDGNPSLETYDNPSLETNGNPSLETYDNPSLATDGNPYDKPHPYVNADGDLVKHEYEKMKVT